MRIVNFLLHGFIGLVLLSHGLIHLIMTSVWDGTSPLLSGMMGSDALSTLVNALLGMTIICYTVAAGGIVRFPVLKNVWMEAAVIGSLTSLMMFALMWNALTPGSVNYIFGPIVSFIVVVSVSLQYWKVRGAVSAPTAIDAKEAQ
jgi:hypothetical protein